MPPHKQMPCLGGDSELVSGRCAGAAEPNHPVIRPWQCTHFLVRFDAWTRVGTNQCDWEQRRVAAGKRRAPTGEWPVHPFAASGHRLTVLSSPVADPHHYPGNLSDGR